ncbi:MAG: A24 family peptidase [Gammaproteobacteria bacterium]|nr:A24 family peptidase [Gammaproteobacteria bacterium]
MFMIDSIIQQPWLLYTALALFGLVIGSFLNVVIYRYPQVLLHSWRQESRALLAEHAGSDVEAAISDASDPPPPGLVWPASHCRHCKASIRPWHNIPLLGFLLLRGRCRDCGKPISWRYPLIETLAAAATVIIVWQFGLGGFALLWIIASYLLLAMTMIDLDHQLLPDPMTYLLLWLGLLGSVAGISGVTPEDAIVGAAVGYLLLWGFYHLFRLLTGKHGMGYGDFKLLAALGALLGWSMLPAVILVASISGAVLGIAWLMIKGQGRQTRIPFGPFLALAGWVALLFGPQLQAIYF